MGYTLTTPALGYSAMSPKNRVWDFLRLSNETHPANRRKPTQPRRKIRPTATKPASGIPCWPSRDPIEEEGGLNLYGFVGNDGVDQWDVDGLWIGPEKTDRVVDGIKVTHPGRQSTEPTTSVCAEKDDTWEKLANKVGLRKADASAWVTDYTDKPITGKTYRVPNTVIAFWAGDNLFLNFGKGYVGWNGQIDYLKNRGFNVESKDHVKGTTLVFQGMVEDASSAKTLQGIYFWGHGGFNQPNASGHGYPATAVGSRDYEPELVWGGVWGINKAGVWYLTKTKSVVLKYKLALALMFACDTNSGESALSAKPAPGAIFHGYNDTLVPIGKNFALRHWLHPGDQSTQK